MILLTDEEIRRLLECVKSISNPRARERILKGSQGRTFDLVGPDDQRFKMYTRQNIRVPNHFSTGLIFCGRGGDVTLTRYNGSDHPHTNALEIGSSFRDQCHIHVATHRYMASGRKPEHYAEPTDRYSTLNGAIRALLEDCNIKGYPDDPNDDDSAQLNLRLPS